MAQTNRFEMELDGASKRWSGFPAIHVAVYGRGRKDRTWMAFPLPPCVVELPARPGVTPKAVRIGRERISAPYEREVPDREPKMWAGVDMNGNSDTYAFPDGRVVVERNDFARQYNRAHGKMLKVKRGGATGASWRNARKRHGTHTKTTSRITPARRPASTRGQASP